MEHNNSRRGRPPRHSVYQRLSEAVAELRDRMGGLPSPTEAEDISTSIWYQEAHQSTALEGNTLVIEQVKALPAQRLAVGNTALRRNVEVTVYFSRSVVPAGAGPNRLVPLAALATKERSVISLRAAIERGRLRAQKGPDGQWRSSRAWVDEYVVSKHRRV